MRTDHRLFLPSLPAICLMCSGPDCSYCRGVWVCMCIYPSFFVVIDCSMSFHQCNCSVNYPQIYKWRTEKARRCSVCLFVSVCFFLSSLSFYKRTIILMIVPFSVFTKCPKIMLVYLCVCLCFMSVLETYKTDWVFTNISIMLVMVNINARHDVENYHQQTNSLS